MNKNDLQRLMDACRSGYEDHELPEMKKLAEQIDQDPYLRDLYERSQRWDFSIGDAFREVDVPLGLASRLHATLNAAHGDFQTLKFTNSDASVVAQEIDKVTVFRRSSADVTQVISRRGSFWKMGLASIAALILMTCGALWWPSGQVLELSSMVHSTMHWRHLVNDQSWQSELKNVLPDYPDRYVAARPRRWQHVKGPLDRRTLVFDLATQGRRRAMLFVARVSTEVRGTTAPPEVPATTGGWSVGVWHEKGYVYVLMVEGREDRYRGLLSRRRPVA